MLRLVTDRFDPPAYDTAVSSAVLRRVAAGTDPATLRLWTPERAVAFGRQDRARPGYGEAVAAARALGYAPVERLAGGKAAVFHEGTLAFAWAMPEHQPEQDITTRFATMARLIVSTLVALGLDARVGEVPGEYCPGEWSVNLDGTHKVMGVGQRLVRGGAHVGGVVVVTGADLVNEALAPVYQSLGYRWRPEATGAIADARPGTTVEEVRASLLAAVASGGETPTPGSLDRDCLELAGALVSEHEPTG